MNDCCHFVAFWGFGFHIQFTHHSADAIQSDIVSFEFEPFGNPSGPISCLGRIENGPR